jgi:hypothetical protein
VGRLLAHCVVSNLEAYELWFFGGRVLDKLSSQWISGLVIPLLVILRFAHHHRLVDSHDHHYNSRLMYPLPPPHVVTDRISTAVMHLTGFRMCPDLILANQAFLRFPLIRPYKLNPVAGLITYLACGLLSLVVGCLSFIWTPSELLLTEVGLESSVFLRDDTAITMMTHFSNGYFLAAEAEDEKGIPGVRVVG